MSKLSSRVDRLERSGARTDQGLVLYEVDAEREEDSLSAEDADQLAEDERAGRLVVLLRRFGGGVPRGRLSGVG